MRRVLLLVNAPAYLEKPHECLAGFEVQTTRADCSIWKTEMLIFFFSMLADVIFKFLLTVSLVQQGQILCQVPSVQCNKLGLFWKFSFHHFFICSLQPDACNSDVFLPTLHYLHVHQICAF